MENAAEDDKHWLNEQNSQKKKRTRGLNNEEKLFKGIRRGLPRIKNYTTSHCIVYFLLINVFDSLQNKSSRC